MASVYYKFKSAKDFSSIPIHGNFVSVANLKERIFRSKYIGSGTDFNLIISNAKTNEEYPDEAVMIPKHSSVLARRVPGYPHMPIVIEPEPKVAEDQIEEAPPAKSGFTETNSLDLRFPDELDWDELSNDLYATSEVRPAQSINLVQDVPSPNEVDEDGKIKALVNTPALNRSWQTQNDWGSNRGFGKAGEVFGRGGLERKTPPQGYICYRCKVPGHFIQHCPTNGNRDYDIRVKPPTTIAAVISKPDEAVFEKEMDRPLSIRLVNHLPQELHCPLCKDVMVDAMQTTKCCFNSFCNKCSRDLIISKSICFCGAINMLADDLVPNITLRNTIDRLLKLRNNSAENDGSKQVQDMESACSSQPKVSSSTCSASSKGQKLPPPHNDATLDMDTRNDGKTVFITSQQSLEKGKTTKNVDLAKEEVLQQLPVGEPAMDMQWGDPQDLVPENYTMPSVSSAYNPYWDGMLPGMEGYVAPYTGSMPYMGYASAPSAFGIPFGGPLPQDPFLGGQWYIMPDVAPQRNLSEFVVVSNSTPPVVSREEFKAQEADLCRKHGESKKSSKERERGREVSNSDGVCSMRHKPRYMSQAVSTDNSNQCRQYHQAEKPSSPEPYAREFKSVQLRNKRSDHHHDEPVAEVANNPGDRKQKHSMFSYNSFPDKEGSEKRLKRKHANSPTWVH